MKEKPILFSAPMVRALLDGSKTQTRRIVKPQPVYADVAGAFQTWQFKKSGGEASALLWPNAKEAILKLCPHGQPGDRLWVRETHSFIPDRDEPPGCSAVLYAADDERYGKLRPSIHMPRWASRIQLEIVSVRVERLNSCTDADALAEGVDRTNTSIGGYAIERYRRLWESINGAGSWDINPWVWVIEFKRLP